MDISGAQFRISHIRNQTETSLWMDGNILHLIGKNGVGKSTILESIAFLINAQPPAGNRGASYLHYNEDHVGFIECTLPDSFSLTRQWSLAIDPVAKKIHLQSQNQAISRIKYLEEQPFRAYLIRPHDLQLLHSDPQTRRIWFDQFLFAAFPSFHTLQKQYLQALKSRNALLKQIRNTSSLQSSLSSWNTLVAQLGSQFEFYRMQFIEYIQVKLPAIQKSIGNNWGLHLHYDPLIEMSTYLQRLEECFNKDVAMGYTTIGPQSQDYYFTVSLDDKKRSADSFFSRWEATTTILELFFAGIDFVSQKNQTFPLLLLDDMFWELDEQHQEAIWNRSQDYSLITAQVFSHNVEKKWWKIVHLK